MRLIDAEELKKEIQHLGNANPSYWNKCDVVDRQDVLDEIDNAETIIPFASVETQTMIEYERPQGEWKSEGYFVFCDYCGSSNGNNKTPFCPYCGAEMKGGAE